VQWDSAKETIAGDAEQEKYVRRPYRAPWSLPQVGASTA
jgi:hypothetical protein